MAKSSRMSGPRRAVPAPRPNIPPNTRMAETTPGACARRLTPPNPSSNHPADIQARSGNTGHGKGWSHEASVHGGQVSKWGHNGVQLTTPEGHTIRLEKDADGNLILHTPDNNAINLTAAADDPPDQGPPVRGARPLNPGETGPPRPEPILNSTQREQLEDFIDQMRQHSPSSNISRPENADPTDWWQILAIIATLGEASVGIHAQLRGVGPFRQPPRPPGPRGGGHHPPPPNLRP